MPRYVVILQMMKYRNSKHWCKKAEKVTASGMHRYF